LVCAGSTAGDGYASLIVYLMYEACYEPNSYFAPYFRLLPLTFPGAVQVVRGWGAVGAVCVVWLCARRCAWARRCPSSGPSPCVSVCVRSCLRPGATAIQLRGPRVHGATAGGWRLPHGSPQVTPTPLAPVKPRRCTTWRHFAGSTPSPTRPHCSSTLTMSVVATTLQSPGSPTLRCGPSPGRSAHSHPCVPRACRATCQATAH
jgi:hypothetical protein